MNLLLFILSCFYGLLFYVWDFCFNCGLFRRFSFSPIILSVGNISVGGSGKTPMTIYLSRLLKSMLVPHVIISRGYKKSLSGCVVVSDGTSLLVSSSAPCGDEAYMMAVKLQNTPILVGDNKKRCINLAIKLFSPKIVLIDDGFQSRYINSDFNLVLLNSLMVASDFRFFPLGRLREPLSSLTRADLVVFTKTNLAASSGCAAKTKGSLLKQGIPFVSAGFSSRLMAWNFQQRSLRPLKFNKYSDGVFAFCGVGDPLSFKKTIGLHYSRVVLFSQYTDHYNYKKNSGFFSDIKRAKKLGVLVCVTTLKDFVKLLSLENFPSSFGLSFHIVDIELSLNDVDNVLKNKLAILLSE